MRTNFWSVPIPEAACWQQGFAIRYGLRLNYSGNFKTMNNHSIGNLGTASHSTQEGDDHKR
jgi:hypothetical protein